MELEDYEPANEFEFDLSDVDVAAFESVATEDTTATANNIAVSVQQEQQIPPQQQHQEQQLQEQQEQQQQQQELIHQDHEQQEGQDQQQQQQQASQSFKTLQNLVPITQQQQQQQQQAQSSPIIKPVQQHHHPIQLQQHHLAQLSSATSGTPGKILLVPINSKPGASGFKNIFQLHTSGTNTLTMGNLTASGNQRQQIIQLAPLQSTPGLSVNNKSNYSTFPVTTTNATQTLPGSSSLGVKQQLYLTMNSSPMKNSQALSLNSVLNKSLNSLPNNSSNISSHFPSSRNLSYTNDSLRTPTPITSAAATEVPKRKPCNCTKSQCLKLYCDCFANGEFCSGCNCTNCFNSLEKEKERQKAISVCLERNPEAFRPKIGKAVKVSVGEPAPESIERRHTKGCNCKRSGCLKNYCECYEAKILCSNLCKCCGCKNYEESFERKSLMQLANSASEHARGILRNLLPTNNNSNTGKEFTKSFITDKVIRASMVCLLQSAQKAEEDGILASNIPNLIQIEMGKCLRMIVDSATESSSPKKR